MAKVAKKAWLWPYLPGFTRPQFPSKPGQKPGKPGLASLFQAGQVFGRAPDARAGFMLVLLFSFFILDLDEWDVYRFLGNRVRFFSVGPEYQLGPDFI